MYPGPYAPVPVPPAAAGRAPRPRARPSAWWYAAAGAVVVAGLVAAGMAVRRTALDYAKRIDAFDRMEVPGTMEVELRDTGGYSIYHEFDGAFDGDAAVGDPLTPRELLAARPTVTITDPSGDELPLASYTSRVNYKTDHHEGIGLYTFHADEPGTYEIVTSGETAPGGSEIAVGRSVSTGVITGVIVSVMLGFAGIVAGAVIAIVVGVRRGRSRRAQMQLGPPLYPTFGPPAAWWPAAGSAAGYGMPPQPRDVWTTEAPPSAMRPAPPPPRPPTSPRPAPPPVDASAPQAPPPAAPSVEASPHPPAPPPAPQPPQAAQSVQAPGSRAQASSQPPQAPTGSSLRDPPSLRANDWSRDDDMPLPWSPDER